MNIKEDDIVKISGIPTSCNDIPVNYINLIGTVGCISSQGYIKIWPDNHPELTEKEKYYGKLWFKISEIQIMIILFIRNDDKDCKLQSDEIIGEPRQSTYYSTGSDYQEKGYTVEELKAQSKVGIYKIIKP